MEGYKPVSEKGIDSSEMSEGQLEERERELSGEISKSIDEINKTTEKVEELLEDEDLSPTLKEAALEKINEIGRRVSDRFANLMLGSAVAGTILAVHQFLMEKGETFIEEGSVLGDANPVALAAVGLYASIKSLKFVVAKLEERNVKNNLDRARVEDAYEAGKYIEKAIDGGYINEEETVDFENIQNMLQRDSLDIWREEGALDAYGPKYGSVERAMERTSSEVSKSLYRKIK